MDEERFDYEVDDATRFVDNLKDRVHDLYDKNEKLKEEIQRLNKLLEDIDTYIHLWKLDDIGEKTMLILNDILLIKNGMSDEVVRLNDSDKE